MARGWDAGTGWQQVRVRRPLVQAVVSPVSASLCAHALAAAGARPLMSRATEEVEDVQQAVDAVVINLGMLTREAATHALRLLQGLKSPVVLDPVGVGFSAWRLRVAEELLATGRVALVKGNALEVTALAGGARVASAGVDAVGSGLPPGRAAREVAARWGVVCAVTGAEDEVWGAGPGGIRIRAGHGWMGEASGTGCAVGCLMGALCGVGRPPWEAAVQALLAAGLAGEQAWAQIRRRRLGSLLTAWVDALGGDLRMEEHGHRITDA